MEECQRGKVNFCRGTYLLSRATLFIRMTRLNPRALPFWEGAEALLPVILEYQQRYFAPRVIAVHLLILYIFVR